jgi:dTDP-4-amino-4,6-dideoxygalactose transaminase
MKTWPLGEIPKELQRPELDQIRELGYVWDFPHQVVEIFEKEISELFGSKYAIAVDSNSNGLFLVLKYIGKIVKLSIPKYTYMSVPMSVHHAGYKFEFDDREWKGLYQLEPLPIWDAAGLWGKDTYIAGKGFQILSFQAKKRLPIGRGGMILTNDETAYKWLKKMCYDSRDLNKSQMDDDITEMGYHMYMTPEDAARGLILLKNLGTEKENTYTWKNYKDLTTNTVFKNG